MVASWRKNFLFLLLSAFCLIAFFITPLRKAQHDTNSKSGFCFFFGSWWLRGEKTSCSSCLSAFCLIAFFITLLRQAQHDTNKKSRLLFFFGSWWLRGEKILVLSLPFASLPLCLLPVAPLPFASLPLCPFAFFEKKIKNIYGFYSFPNPNKSL